MAVPPDTFNHNLASGACFSSLPFSIVRQNGIRAARSVWSAWSLLPLSNRPRLTIVPASSTHSKRFASGNVRPPAPIRRLTCVLESLIRRRQLPEPLRHVQHRSALMVAFGPHVGLRAAGWGAAGLDGRPPAAVGVVDLVLGDPVPLLALG